MGYFGAEQLQARAWYTCDFTHAARIQHTTQLSSCETCCSVLLTEDHVKCLTHQQLCCIFDHPTTMSHMWQRSRCLSLTQKPHQ